MLEERADDGQRGPGALSPIIAAERDGRGWTTNPRADDEVGMYEHEPTIGAVLRGPRLARELPRCAVGRSHVDAGTVIEHAAHHVDQLVSDGRRHGLPTRAFEARHHAAVD